MPWVAPGRYPPSSGRSPGNRGGWPAAPCSSASRGQWGCSAECRSAGRDLSASSEVAPPPPNSCGRARTRAPAGRRRSSPETAPCAAPGRSRTPPQAGSLCAAASRTWRPAVWFSLSLGGKRRVWRRPCTRPHRISQDPRWTRCPALTCSPFGFVGQTHGWNESFQLVPFQWEGVSCFSPPSLSWGSSVCPVYSLLKLLEAEKENTGSDSNENHGSWKHLDSRAFEFLFVCDPLGPSAGSWM